MGRGECGGHYGCLLQFTVTIEVEYMNQGTSSGTYGNGRRRRLMTAEASEPMGNTAEAVALINVRRSKPTTRPATRVAWLQQRRRRRARPDPLTVHATGRLKSAWILNLLLVNETSKSSVRIDVS